PMGQASGINDRGHVCGVAHVSIPSQTGEAPTVAAHACLYRDNYVHDLGILPGMRFSAAVALNDPDEVIGRCENQAIEDSVPFLYRDEVIYNLEHLTHGTRGCKL